MSEAEEAKPILLDDLPVMSKAELLRVAIEHGGYETPSLNDTLYLHFKGYRRIENLEEYTGLKSLWLHSNGFAKIENLSHLKELRCLFLQSNSLTRIENLPESLVQLDLSENSIRIIEGLSHLVNLTTLNLAKNEFEDTASIQHLTECKNLSFVDLSHNKLAGKDVLSCLAGIEQLRSLNMSGNPVCGKVAHFRKRMTVANKSLRYLDRPIFDDERVTAEEWSRSGPDAERVMKEKLVTLKREKERNTMQEFRQWQESVRSTADESNAEDEEAVVRYETFLPESEEPLTTSEVKDVFEPRALVAEEQQTDIEKENVEPRRGDVLDSDALLASHDVKSLSAYLNAEGQRKTLEEVLVDAKLPSVVLAADALSFDVVTSDEEVEIE